MLKSQISNAWRFFRWHWGFWFHLLRVFSIDYLCGEIYVTKYVYVDFEEYLNLFKYDCFLYIIILQLNWVFFYSKLFQINEKLRQIAKVFLVWQFHLEVGVKNYWIDWLCTWFLIRATTASLSQARTNVLTGCFFIRVFLINYGKILKFSIVELEKRNGTQNDREKNCF